ncbi:uncharacterized protein LOC131928039 [Physella acuta]|uniref:uncharacterized protein LOC131928039 n=1 Tax=Physella acuta TaxID=109671 RepID=UPI0027DE1010|nr:uncharacterized protein LOC131928039 [Physella acuta]
MFKLVLVLSIGYIAEICEGKEQIENCNELEKCMDPNVFVTPANVESLYDGENSEALQMKGNKFYTCYYTSMYKCSDPVRNNYLKSQLKLVTFLRERKNDIIDLSKCKDKDRIKRLIAFVSLDFWQNLIHYSFEVIEKHMPMYIWMDKYFCKRFTQLKVALYFKLINVCPENAAEALSWYWGYYHEVNFEVYSWCYSDYIGKQTPARDLYQLVLHPRVKPPDLSDKNNIQLLEDKAYAKWAFNTVAPWG